MTATTTSSLPKPVPSAAPDEFDTCVAALAGRLSALPPGTPVFTVAAERDPFLVYAESFTNAEQRRLHSCSACRSFLQRYGLLVTIDESGRAEPLFWSGAALPTTYAPAAAALAALARSSPISGVFLSEAKVWGVPLSTAGWRHFAATSPAPFTHPLKTAGQAMAEKHEERAMLLRALHDYPLPLVNTAVGLLRTESLYRSEKVAGVGEWLLELHQRLASTKDARQRDNLVWRAVAAAPVGFAHVRSSMIGTLLDDLASGMAFEDVKMRFAAKMHPLQYQRPTAAPSEGNIAQAEAIMAKLRTAGALRRRFARLEELVALWQPAPIKAKEGTGGLFDHLRTKLADRPKQLDVPPVTMTWEKFARTVLPSAEAIELRAPAGPGPFFAFVTAADPDAPPMLQWDLPEKRNPVSWYLYVNGSMPSRWNVTGGAWCKVTAITAAPAHWDGEARSHHARSAAFVLDGARDLHHEAGGGLFPENLKSDYHSIRKTLEAHFKQSVIEGKEQATACGLLFQAGRQWDQLVRVTAGGLQTSYCLDRWD